MDGEAQFVAVSEEVLLETIEVEVIGGAQAGSGLHESGESFDDGVEWQELVALAHAQDVTPVEPVLDSGGGGNRSAVVIAEFSLGGGIVVIGVTIVIAVIMLP